MMFKECSQLCTREYGQGGITDLRANGPAAGVFMISKKMNLVDIKGSFQNLSQIYNNYDMCTRSVVRY